MFVSLKLYDDDDSSKTSAISEKVTGIISSQKDG